MMKSKCILMLIMAVLLTAGSAFGAVVISQDTTAVTAVGSGDLLETSLSSASPVDTTAGVWGLGTFGMLHDGDMNGGTGNNVFSPATYPTTVTYTLDAGYDIDSMDVYTLFYDTNRTQQVWDVRFKNTSGVWSSMISVSYDTADVKTNRTVTVADDAGPLAIDCSVVEITFIASTSVNAESMYTEADVSAVTTGADAFYDVIAKVGAPLAIDATVDWVGTPGTTLWSIYDGPSGAVAIWDPSASSVHVNVAFDTPGNYTLMLQTSGAADADVNDFIGYLVHDTWVQDHFACRYFHALHR